MTTPDPPRRAPRHPARDRAHEVHEAVRALLGERFGELRIEPDDHILITVVDLTRADEDAVREIARRHGIGGWVRIRCADRAALTAWEQVRQELLYLRRTRPDALVIWPTPNPGYRQPPFSIRLQAHAIDAAATLHERFGVYVELRVGARRYPPQAGEAEHLDQYTGQSRATVDPAEIRAELDGPLTVASGHRATHGLRLTNLGGTRIQVNGHLVASVADPATRRVVGGHTGPQVASLVVHRIEPGDTVRIPLLVGTESFEPTLGYAVPPGEWSLFVTLRLSDGRMLETPRFPFTITGPADRITR